MKPTAAWKDLMKRIEDKIETLSVSEIEGLTESMKRRKGKIQEMLSYSGEQSVEEN